MKSSGRASILTLLGTLAIVAFIATPSHAGNLVAFGFATGMGNSNSDTGDAIAVDPSQNVYTTGRYIGQVDFDPGPGSFVLDSAVNGRVFIQKLDTNGNLVWAKALGGDRGWGIALDSSGNVYTTGIFTGSGDFDPGPSVSTLTAAGIGEEVFVSKLDSAGNFVWAKSMGGMASDAGYAIAVDTSGSVYITGSYSGTADFDPGPGTFPLTSGNVVDVFVVKLDTDGNFVWAKSMGGNGGDEAYGIAVDTAGNVYTTGYFAFIGTSGDFDPGPGVFTLNSAGSSDIFLSKLDSNGDFVWAKRFGNSSIDVAQAIALDSSGNVWTTGSFIGTVDFDPDVGVQALASAGAADIYVSKLNSAGEYVLARAMGGGGGDVGLAIAVDSVGSVYTTGYYSTAGDFDPGPGTAPLFSAGNSEIFISKLDAGGGYLWAKTVSGSVAERGTAIAVDNVCNVYTTGWFIGPSDFDPGPGQAILNSTPPFDVFDIFVYKLGNPIPAGAPASDRPGLAMLCIALIVAGGIAMTRRRRVSPSPPSRARR